MGQYRYAAKKSTKKKPLLPAVCILLSACTLGLAVLYSWQPANKALAKVVPIHPTIKQTALVKHTAAAPVHLRNDGVKGTPTKKFLAVQNTYRLMFSPTYDGSGQATHPKLLYFPNGWNGYKYWMSYTPYPAMNASLENPCIVTSNDLKTWVVPKNLKNPVSGIPSDVKRGGHYSDSELVMHGNTMELWYRYNRAGKKLHQTDYSIDYYYRRTSADGIHWSAAKLMQTSSKSIMSLAIVYQNNRYQFWYTDFYRHLMYAQSIDGTHWFNTRRCSLNLPVGYVPWHQDVVYYQGRYYLLQTGLSNRKYSFSLFLSESSDGVHFLSGTAFYPSSNPVILHRAWLYRSTMVPLDNRQFDMVVSYMLPGNKWFMTQFTLPVAEWDRACLTNRELILKAPTSSKTSRLNHIIAPSSSAQNPLPYVKAQNPAALVP